MAEPSTQSPIAFPAPKVPENATTLDKFELWGQLMRAGRHADAKAVLRTIATVGGRHGY